MGMSASQARLLSLTARMSDLELQAQTISNAKIRLADMSGQASTDYSKALDKETLKVYTGLQSDGTSSYMEATAAKLTTYQGVSTTDKQRYIKNSAGQVLVDQNTLTQFNASTSATDFASKMGSGTDTGKIQYYTNLYNEMNKDGKGGCTVSNQDNLTDSKWLTDQVNAGNLFLYENNATGGSDGKGDNVNVSWTSGDASLNMETDKTDIAKAEAKYESTMASIQSKDKRFDLQLKQIDTEHQAIQTEVDSVKKVIDKNIERSFKIFSA